jgi:hypothetical protein
MMIKPKDRFQVEYGLGRPLTDEELVVVEDLASLPPSHLAVIEYLYKREDGVAALCYLIGVTTDIDRSTLLRARE